MYGRFAEKEIPKIRAVEADRAPNGATGREDALHVALSLRAAFLQSAVRR